MSGQIFISYRREESRWSARSLHDRLCRNFDPKQIFMDIDAIALGEDFVKSIEATVAKCDVLIAVIGNNWLTSKNDHGDRRLDNPDDFVRMEIGAALKREISVIPVLVDAALIPRAIDLPEDLKSLVRRNALRITDTSFDGDCQRLAAAIRQILEKAAAEKQGREEKERLDAEQQQREKDRLETERCEPEEKERLARDQPEGIFVRVEHAKPASKYKESAGAEKAQEPSEKERKKQLQKPEAAMRVSPEGAEAERGKTKRPAQEIPQPLQKVLSTSTAKVVMLRLASVCCFILGPLICMGVFATRQNNDWPLLFLVFGSLLIVAGSSVWKTTAIKDGKPPRLPRNS